MSSAAVAARERRGYELETKRFNNTLKEFIEFKYDNIFEEYNSFYKALTEKYPNKKNLMKTAMFKEWKKHTIEQSFEKEGVHAEVTHLTDPADSDPESSSEENACDELSERESVSEENVRDEPSNQAESDILSTVIVENFSEQHDLININELEDVDNIIAEIVQDLERDGEIREMLDENMPQNDDEGIALDYQTELDAVVEPFDYELEVGF